MAAETQLEVGETSWGEEITEEAFFSRQPRRGQHLQAVRGCS